MLTILVCQGDEFTLAHPGTPWHVQGEPPLVTTAAISVENDVQDVLAETDIDTDVARQPRLGQR
jgi:hypothetical protein